MGKFGRGGGRGARKSCPDFVHEERVIHLLRGWAGGSKKHGCWIRVCRSQERVLRTSRNSLFSLSVAGIWDSMYYLQHA